MTSKILSCYNHTVQLWRGKAHFCFRFWQYVFCLNVFYHFQQNHYKNMFLFIPYIRTKFESLSSKMSIYLTTRKIPCRRARLLDCKTVDCKHILQCCYITVDFAMAATQNGVLHTWRNISLFHNCSTVWWKMKEIKMQRFCHVLSNIGILMKGKLERAKIR